MVDKTLKTIANVALNKSNTLVIRQYGIVLKDQFGEPYSDMSYTITWDKETIRGITSGTGLVSFEPLRHRNPPEKVIVSFRLDPTRSEIHRLEVALDALELNCDTPMGLQQRLTNMDVLTCPLDGDIGPLTEVSIKALQYLHQLPLSGEVDQDLKDWFDLNDKQL